MNIYHQQSVEQTFCPPFSYSGSQKYPPPSWEFSPFPPWNINWIFEVCIFPFKQSGLSLASWLFLKVLMHDPLLAALLKAKSQHFLKMDLMERCRMFRIWIFIHLLCSSQHCLYTVWRVFMPCFACRQLLLQGWATDGPPMNPNPQKKKNFYLEKKVLKAAFRTLFENYRNDKWESLPLDDNSNADATSCTCLLDQLEEMFSHG